MCNILEEKSIKFLNVLCYVTWHMQRWKHGFSPNSSFPLVRIDEAMSSLAGGVVLVRKYRMSCRASFWCRPGLKARLRPYSYSRVNNQFNVSPFGVSFLHFWPLFRFVLKINQFTSCRSCHRTGVHKDRLLVTSVGGVSSCFLHRKEDIQYYFTQQLIPIIMYNNFEILWL